MTKEDDNLFDDNNQTEAATSTTESTKEETKDEGSTSTEGADGIKNEEGQTGEATTSEPPSEGTEGKGTTSAEKMIPESRFKAALKDVTEKLDAATNELSTLKAVPAPDKDSDPEGYDLHTRMETSKAIMRDLVPDYDVVIKHYKEMADANPYINQATAAHPAPAKFAYDLAKKSLELQELGKVANSPEYKAFLEAQKNKQPETQKEEKAGKQVAEGLSPTKVPNLNKAASVNKNNLKVDDTDQLFEGAL